MRDGTIDNLLIVLEQGAVLPPAVESGGRFNHPGKRHLFALPGHDRKRCPRRPSWAITAVRVIDEPSRNRVRFEGGRLQLSGLPCRCCRCSTSAQPERRRHGFLVPDITYSSVKGVEIALPYHWQIGPNRDLTLTPTFTRGLPGFEAKYRQLNSFSAFSSSRLPHLRDD